MRNSLKWLATVVEAVHNTSSSTIARAMFRFVLGEIIDKQGKIMTVVEEVPVYHLWSEPHPRVYEELLMMTYVVAVRMRPLFLLRGVEIAFIQ